MNRVALIADTVFDGVTQHQKAAVVIVGDTIREVRAASALPRHIPTLELPQTAWLAPGFIDLRDPPARQSASRSGLSLTGERCAMIHDPTCSTGSVTSRSNGFKGMCFERPASALTRSPLR
jgi:hypothetical protein